MVYSRRSELTEMDKGAALFLVACAYGLALFAAWAVLQAVPGEWSLLGRTAAADAAATVVIYLLSRFTGNASLYDPYWSVAPPVLFGYWFVQRGVGMGLWDWLFLAAVLFWGIRLTVNWAVRWRGFGDEDWRYREFRGRFGRWFWAAELFFIDLYPSFQVFLASLPAYWFITRGTGAGAASGGFFWSSAAAAGIFIMAVGTVLELAADRQMDVFKRARRAGEKKRQVIDEGLWRISRHPNYLGELMIWFGIYVAALSIPGMPWWAVLFPISMLIMFLSVSIPWMEKKILRTRPEYREVQRTIPILIPFLPPRKHQQRTSHE